MGTIWEVSLGDFLLVTVFLGGGAAFMTGRSVAHTWRSPVQLVVYIVGLAAAVRFIHYALFGGTLLSLQYFIVDLVILLIIGGFAFRVVKVAQMVAQYAWLYERQSLFSWRNRA
jgi:uncharacterized protein DUF6867